MLDIEAYSSEEEEESSEEEGEASAYLERMEAERLKDEMLMELVKERFEEETRRRRKRSLTIVTCDGTFGEISPANRSEPLSPQCIARLSAKPQPSSTTFQVSLGRTMSDSDSDTQNAPEHTPTDAVDATGGGADETPVDAPQKPVQ